jgi:hypothetical protein
LGQKTGYCDGLRKSSKKWLEEADFSESAFLSAGINTVSIIVPKLNLKTG